MPTIYEVQAPDGRILEIEGPDNAPQDQIMLAAQDIYSRMQSEASQTSPAETQQQPAEEESGFTLADFGEGAKEYGKSIVRGFGSGLLSAGSGLAELADVATDRLGLEDLIDSGDENELIRLANSGQEFLQDNFGVSDTYKDSWLTMFGEGVGSIGSFLVPGGALGAIGKGVGLTKGAIKTAQTVAAATQGGGLGAAEQAARIEQSRARGVDVSEDQADAAIAFGTLAGTSEAFAPLNILKKIRFLRDPETSNRAFDMVSSALKTGTIEGAQEVAASLMQDAIQMGIYDENIPVGESLWDEFTVGAAAGALVDAATSGMFRRRGGLSRDVERQREELIRQEEERQRERYFDDIEEGERGAIAKEIIAAMADQEEAAQNEEQARKDIADFQTRMSEQYRAEQEAKLNEPYATSRGSKTVAQQGKEYAEQLSRNASIRSGLFPETGRFDIREELAGPQGTVFSVYNTADGKVYGQPTNDLEFAKHLTLGLNNEMVNRNVNRGIIEAMDLAPESYDPQTSETIYAVGQRLNRPKSYTISEATLNEAAGTVQTPDSPYLENLSLDQIHQIQYGVPPFQDGKKKLYKDMNNLTMSQQINLERARKGLPPLREFTLAEAKDALGDKYDKVFDVLLDVQQPDMQKIREEFGEAGVNVQGGRQRYQDEVNTRREVEATLNNKNIISPINSKEIKYVFKKITGEQSIDKMSPSQRMYLVGELKRMPTLAKAAKLPDFTPRPYTRKDFDNAMSRVTSTGDGTLENIKEAMPEGLTERRKSTMANLIRAELLTRGVINKDGSVSELASLPDLRPAPTEKAPIVQPDFTAKQSEQALAFESELNKKLKGMGLDDIRLKVLDQIREIGVTREGRAIEVAQKRNVSRAEGFFDQRSRTIVLSLDSAMQAARDNSPEAFDFALNDVLNHETVHALRNLDLWTNKEWSLLENATKKLVVPGQGNKTFFQDASERYSDLSPVGRMEEAVAELIRYSKRDRSIIGGKPRTLIDRMFEFFRRMASAVKGTGYNTLNDLLDNIESGGLGARERGVVRTARATERLMGAIPARGIGRDIDMVELPVINESGATADINAVTDNISASLIRDYKPKKTVRAYKLFTKGEDGKLYPLFVDADAEVPVGEWMQANFPEYKFTAANGRVYVPSRGTGGAKGTGDNIAIPDQATRDMLIKAGFLPEGSTAKTITAVAARPGWHAGDSPSAKHIGGEPTIDGVKYKVRKPNQVWAEVEMPADTDWQSEAEATAGRTADGKLKVKEADINDRLPSNGYYRYKTNPNMEGNWLISGEMKVVRELSRDEVKEINKRNGTEDLPTESELMAMSEKERSKYQRKGKPKYVGAPKGLDSGQALGRMRKVIDSLAKEGEGGRFWYERSGRALLEITGGDREKAKRLAQAIAITSPQTPVPTNFSYAMQAYYQHEAGEPIVTGMYPKSMSQKLQDVFDGKDWEGRKTNNFYTNVMREIDPTLDQGVTTDLWMMRAFGYDTDAPTDAQYTFAENETARLAEKLGWEPQQVQAAIWVAIKGRMEAPEVKKRTEERSIKKGYMHYEKNKDGKNVRVIDNESKHRGIWIEEALKYNPTGADKEKAKFDFEDARDNNLAQISWESIPGATADHMPEIFGAEYPVIQQYHVDISKAFLDEDGNDLVAKELGVLSPGDFEAPGYFEGRVSPGTQTQVVSPKRYKAVDISKIDKQLKEGKITKEQAEELMGERLDPQSEDAIAAYAAARGILMKQDGVGYHRPFYDKSMRKLDLNGAEINIGRPFTEKETADFAQIMADISGHGEFNPIASPNGARLINFDYLMPDGQSYTNQKERGEFNQNFNNMVVKGLARMQFENGESVQLDRFYAKAGYLGNNWEENKNGEGYYADIAARSPDLSRRVYDIVRKIQPRIEAIDQEYASKFGWTINDSINRVFRRPDPATGRADQADYEATVRGAVRPNGNLALTHYGNKKINVTNPLLSGTGADRFKRNKAPNAIWYGITDAEVSPYVRESMIPQVENKFEIPLDELYVIADRDNANVPVDPLNVFTKNLRGDVDYESILDKVTDNGYTGFIINAPAYGKVAVIRKPLKAIPEDASIEIDNQGDLNDIVESRRRVDNILSQEPQGSMARIYNEEVMRPILEEQQMRGTPFSWQAKSYSTGDKIIYQAADKLIGLKNAEEQINAARRAAGLPPIANKDSAYVGEESIPGKIGIEIKDFQENIQRPLARKIANNNLTIEEVDEFLTFRHAIERNNRIALRDQSRNVETNPGSGSLKTGDRLSNSFVKATMRRKYGLEWNDATESWEGGNERARKLLDVASDIDKITRQTTDRLVSGGLLSRENGEALKRLYKYYAPLKGKAQEDDLADLVAVSSGLSTKGKEYMRAFGRESAAESPLGHIMLNAERAISRAVKNQSFGERLVNLIKENPNEDFWEVYSEDNPRFKMAFDKYYTYIGSDPAMSGQRFKEIPQGMSSRDFVQYSTFNKDGLLKLDNDLIGAKIGGKEYFINIKDDRLRRAIQSVNAGEAANALRKFSMVNRWLSMMNTSLNPEFVIGNFSRDLQTAIYNVIGEQTMTGGKIKDQKRIVRRILKDVIPSMGAVYKGMRRYDLKDGTLRGSTGMSQQDYNDFREFMESGAKADWFYNRPAEEQAQTIENMINMERGTFSGNFRRRYENVRDFVEDANASVENAVRFAAFKAARDELLDSGVSRDEAVATASTLAKNLTVNFNRKGMQGDLLNSLFLFYNASVQGTLNFARGLNVFDPGSSRMKQGMVASMIGFGALMALKAEEESEENPDTGRSYYSEIPDYVKERNIVIMKENGKDYYTIPLPYGYNVFHVAGSKLYEMKSDLISPVKAASDLTSAFMGSFSPIGFFPLPTVTQPFWEIAKNENYFGSPIYKENFPTGTQVPASQLAMSTTRTPFKVAAKILNGLTGGNEYESGYIDVSPDALEHIAEFAFGGAGTFGLRNMNALEKWAKGEELETREMPFIRRIMGEPNEQMSMSDYYDRKVKLEQKEAALEGYRGAERLQYRNRNKDYITMFNLLDQSERQLRQLRKARSEIRTAAALSPANAKAYAEREEQIEGAIQKIYDRFNKYYDERVGRTK